MEDILPSKSHIMKDVIIIGSGSHGAEIDEYILYSREKSAKNSLNIIGFLDDNPGKYQNYKFSAPFLGGIKDHRVRKDCYYIIGIANLKNRKMFVEKFSEKGADFITFIHCN